MKIQPASFGQIYSRFRRCRTGSCSDLPTKEGLGIVRLYSCCLFPNSDQVNLTHLAKLWCVIPYLHQQGHYHFLLLLVVFVAGFAISVPLGAFTTIV